MNDTNHCRLTNTVTQKEVEYLKSQLLQKERLVKQKDNPIFKLQVEHSSGKKELSTSRAYIVKLEGDIKDPEHSLQIQKQLKESKVEENCINGNTVSEYENIKTYCWNRELDI